MQRKTTLYVMPHMLKTLVCLVQVLAYWLLILNLVEADKAMSCVVSIAKEAIAHCSGEECARDEAGRQEQVDHFERQLQTLLAARGAAGFDTLMCEDKWRSFCGQVSISSLTVTAVLAAASNSLLVSLCHSWCHCVRQLVTLLNCAALLQACYNGHQPKHTGRMENQLM